jgi:hypothetical protein
MHRAGNIVLIAGSHGNEALMKNIVSIDDCHNFIKGYFPGILYQAETTVGAFGGRQYLSLYKYLQNFGQER